MDMVEELHQRFYLHRAHDMIRSGRAMPTTRAAMETYGTIDRCAWMVYRQTVYGLPMMPEN